MLQAWVDCANIYHSAGATREAEADEGVRVEARRAQRLIFKEPLEVWFFKKVGDQKKVILSRGQDEEDPFEKISLNSFGLEWALWYVSKLGLFTKSKRVVNKARK